MDERKNVISCCYKRLEDGDQMTMGSKENLKEVKEARNRCEEAGQHCISEGRRGIARKYKTQEKGSDNVEVMSIDSRAVQTSSPCITLSPGKVLGQSDSRYSKSLSYLPSSPVSTLKTMGLKQKTKMGSAKNNNFSETSTMKLLVKIAIQDDNIELRVNKSDCESSSSLESVAANSLQDRKVLSRKILAGCSKRGQDGVNIVDSPSIQKKKAKIVSLSCMQSPQHKIGRQANIFTRSSRTKQFPSQPHSRPCSTRSTTYRRKQEEDLNKDLNTLKSAAGKTTDTTNTTSVISKSDFTMAVEKYEMPQPIIDLFIPIVKFSEFINVELKICTPSHDQPWHSSPPTGDSPMISNKQSTASTLQSDVPSEQNILSEEKSAKKNVCQLLNEEGSQNSVESSQLDLDLDHNRSLPLTFMSRAKKACPDISGEAFDNSMWQLLESKKEQYNQYISGRVGTEKMNLLDNILGNDRLDLECLTLLNTQVDEFTEASSLNEAVQHLTTRGFHIPEQREENDLYSEKLERALRESEHLLAELNLLNDDTMHSSPNQFLDRAHELGRNVSLSHRDLRKCHKDLNLFMS